MEHYRLFLDTNVILDMLLNRAEGRNAQTIINNISKEDCFISLSSFYTISYYVEKYLKKGGILGEKKMEMLRSIMNDLLDILSVYGIDENRLRLGINDSSFNDIEDSFQMQTALAAECNFVITGNTKDFEHSNAIRVMTPSEFIQEYINH